MKKKIHFIWVYSIVLFSLALVLILVSALSQLNLTPSEASGIPESEKQQLFNQTAQQNIANLISENEQLKSDYAKAQKALSERDSSGQRLAAYEQLLLAKQQADENKVSAAKKTLEEMDTTNLSESALHMYNSLTKQLSKGGKL